MAFPSHSIAIVGNAPITREMQGLIADYDKIIRFNQPPESHYHHDMRTDVLVIANSAKNMAIALRKDNYQNSIVFRSAERILLPYHPEIIRKYMPRPNPLSWLKGRRRDYTPRWLKISEEHSKPVSILPADLYEHVCQKLEIQNSEKKRLVPSSGVLTIMHMIKASNAKIDLFGFGFTGWKYHKWDAEKQLIEQKVNQKFHVE